MIGSEARRRADAALDDIAQKHGVRILLAIESGSRAWGFPSQDSDYDVRFIYLRRIEDYLSVETPRDVIETPIDAMLDLGGWDVRKALALIARSNAVALEWLTSPVVYRAEPSAHAALLTLAHATADLHALAYHYDRLARHAWTPDAPGPVRLKSYCYALRPSLALLWLRTHGTPPPMDLAALRTGVPLPSEVAARLDALLVRKAAGTEVDHMPREPALEGFLHTTLDRPVPRPQPAQCSSQIEAADRLFRDLVS